MTAKTHVIYLITINGVPYVGKTGSFRIRRNNHITALQRNNHDNSHLQRAYNKYGPDAFKMSILERCTSREVDKLEREWIAIYDSYSNGFNMTPGGEGGLSIHCEWNGIAYPSITVAAEANGITFSTMRERVEKGYKCDADLRPNRKVVTWNGTQYPSIRAAARANGCAITAMEQRIRKGYRCDADMPGKGSSNGSVCYWDGIEYPSISAAAKALGLTFTGMWHRVQKGYMSDADMTVEREARC